MVGSCPKWHEIDLIKLSSGKEVRIIQGGASKWNSIATRLHFTLDMIDEISENNPKDVQGSCKSVFSKWLKGTKGLREPRTWRTVVDVLHEAGLGELAKSLEEIMSSGK